MLGHAKVGTTMDIYSHVMPTLQKEAADRFDLAVESAVLNHVLGETAVNSLRQSPLTEDRGALS